MAVATSHVKMMKAEGYLPASVAARAIGVNPTTVYRWVERGVVQGKRIGKSWFVLVDDLLELHEAAPAIQKAIRQAS
jgi:transposase-like protein